MQFKMIYVVGKITNIIAGNYPKTHKWMVRQHFRQKITLTEFIHGLLGNETQERCFLYKQINSEWA